MEDRVQPVAGTRYPALPGNTRRTQAQCAHPGIARCPHRDAGPSGRRAVPAHPSRAVVRFLRQAGGFARERSVRAAGRLAAHARRGWPRAAARGGAGRLDPAGRGRMQCQRLFHGVRPGPVSRASRHGAPAGGMPGLGSSLSPSTPPWCNQLGLPAASVYAGHAANGLPIGVQLVGRQHDDAAVLAASHAYERAVGRADGLLRDGAGTAA
ncbi:hypothetical protein GO497_07385 [Acidovorax citrulli]|nr:hypothetical protein [Paracidovorax citrulli]